MAKIITISGSAEAGKDLTASILKEKLELFSRKTLVVHYADYLKYIASQYFGWDGQKDEKGRGKLQYIGTDIVRAKRPNFWVDTVIRLITLFEYQYDYFIIPDTRFPNEIESLKYCGFKVIPIHVERIDYKNSLTEEQRQHKSETALDDYKFDYNIKSKSGKENLEQEIERILFNLLGGQ